MIQSSFPSNPLHRATFAPEVPSAPEIDYSPEYPSEEDPHPPASRTPLSGCKAAAQWVGVRIALLLIGLVWLLILSIHGESSRLVCTRDEPRGPVNCTSYRSWLWIIPLGATELNDVRVVTVTEATDQDLTGYRVEVLTAKGNYVPLTFSYTYGSWSKSAAAEKLENFLQSGIGSIEIYIEGTFSLEALAWLGLLVLCGGCLIGVLIITTRLRSKAEQNRSG